MADDPYRQLREAAEAALGRGADYMLWGNATLVLALLAERDRLHVGMRKGVALMEEADNKVAELEAALRKSEERTGRLAKALEPFTANVTATSLAKALGHITREHLLSARAALAKSLPPAGTGETTDD